MQSLNLGIPNTNQHRVVIVGGGFGGLKAANILKNKENVQVVLIDKNNYHQFQPLFYQVAMSGLEPASILFPLRKIFHKSKNIFVRTTTAISIEPSTNILITTDGNLHYDSLLLCMGAGNHYFNNANLEKNTVGMKNVSQAIFLRNIILEELEKKNNHPDYEFPDIAVIGGGPTGVEICGSLAEMKNHVLHKDYPDLNFQEMQIRLIENSPLVLNQFPEKLANKATNYLKQLGVELHFNCKAEKIENNNLYLSNGTVLKNSIVIWAAGIRANSIAGLPQKALLPNNRILTDEYLKVIETENIYCIGDQAFVPEKGFEKGHPQIAQPAIQQGKLFAKNLLNSFQKKSAKPFQYKDLGSMATVGRNKAVAQLMGFKISGFFAWAIWMFVHLMAIVGVKNRLFIFINWCWNYITYDQSLRLLIKPEKRETD